eukprot:1407721-Alexandrium_andersonii.AAC.1
MWYAFVSCCFIVLGSLVQVSVRQVAKRPRCVNDLRQGWSRRGNIVTQNRALCSVVLRVCAALCCSECVPVRTLLLVGASLRLAGRRRRRC